MHSIKQIGICFIIVSAFATGLFFCESEDSENSSASSITVSTTPVAGGILNTSSTIVGTIQYDIKGFDAINKNYIARIWFKKSSGYGSSNTSFSSSYVIISNSSGSATLSYAISNEFGDATFVKPIVIKYSLNAYAKSASINSIDWDATCIAVSDAIIFN